MFDIIKDVFDKADVPVFETKYPDVVRYNGPLTYAVKKAIVSEIEERTHLPFIFL